MNRIKTLTLLLMIILSVGISAQNPRSAFTDRPVDEAAIYFTPENFKVKADGRMDVSEALQEALNRTKQKENGCGISFIPEGVYKLSKTNYFNTIQLHALQIVFPQRTIPVLRIITYTKRQFFQLDRMSQFNIVHILSLV